MLVKRIIFLLIGAFLSLPLNYFFLEIFLIPDPCYYHTHETTSLFDLFYSLTSDNGYHPFPTMLNFVVTICVGMISGELVFRKTINR